LKDGVEVCESSTTGAIDGDVYVESFKHLFELLVLPSRPAEASDISNQWGVRDIMVTYPYTMLVVNEVEYLRRCINRSP
jgi:hypothetical protein